MAQAGFKLPMELRVPLNFQSSFLYPPSAGVTGMDHASTPSFYGTGGQARDLRLLGDYPSLPAESP